MVAELFRKWAAGTLDGGRLQRLFTRIATFIKAATRALRGEGYVDAAVVMERIASGEVGRRRGGDFGIEEARNARIPIMDAWRDTLRKVYSGKVDLSSYVHVSSVGPVLRAVGVPTGRITMPAGKILKANKDHDIVGALIKLPALLADPELIIRQDRDDSDFRIVTSAADRKGNPIVINLKAQGATKNGAITSIVMTVHEWDDAIRSIQNAISADKIVYLRDSAITHKRELTGDDPLKGSRLRDLLRRDGPTKVVIRADVVKSTSGGEKYRRMGLGGMAAIKERALGAADKKRLSQLLTDAMSGKAGLLSLVPGRALFSELATSLPSARSYLRFKEDMDAERGDWHAKTDAVAQEWRHILSKNGEANAALMSLMHDATLPAQRRRPFTARGGTFPARHLFSNWRTPHLVGAHRIAGGMAQAVRLGAARQHRQAVLWHLPGMGGREWRVPLSRMLERWCGMNRAQRRKIRHKAEPIAARLAGRCYDFKGRDLVPLTYACAIAALTRAFALLLRSEARQLLWSERGFHKGLTARSYIGRGMRHAWACVRAAVASRQSARAAFLALGRTATEIKAAILCLECKDRLTGPDWQALHKLHSELRAAEHAAAA